MHSTSYFRRVTTSPLIHGSHAGRQKSFVHVQTFFRSLACENESGRVKTFTKRVYNVRKP